MEELPQAPRCDCQSIVWVPPVDQWADGEKDPGNRSFPANLLPRPPALLEPVYWLCRVRPELPSSTIHWTHSLPVRARFPATFVPLGRGTIRCTCSGLLVPREREGLGRSTPCVFMIVFVTNPNRESFQRKKNIALCIVVKYFHGKQDIIT